MRLSCVATVSLDAAALEADGGRKLHVAIRYGSEGPNATTLWTPTHVLDAASGNTTWAIDLYRLRPGFNYTARDMCCFLHACLVGDGVFTVGSR